jgi:hypothetical protein
MAGGGGAGAEHAVDLLPRADLALQALRVHLERIEESELRGEGARRKGGRDGSGHALTLEEWLGCGRSNI